MPDTDAEWFDRPGGEPVELQEPSPAWAEIAERWIADIARVLPVAVRIEHVGSTAVPGLVAKPVIDLMVCVPDVDDEAAFRPGLESLGLVLRAREPGHRFFRPPAGQLRTVHVHVCEPGSAWERQWVVFRDGLRARPELADEYAALKRRLAAELGSDRTAYTEAKAAFIRSVLDSGADDVR